jgi:hypothetical protein
MDLSPGAVTVPFKAVEGEAVAVLTGEDIYRLTSIGG